jgi:hypothetical protein
VDFGSISSWGLKNKKEPQIFRRCNYIYGGIPKGAKEGMFMPDYSQKQVMITSPMVINLGQKSCDYKYYNDKGAHRNIMIIISKLSEEG